MAAPDKALVEDAGIGEGCNMLTRALCVVLCVAGLTAHGTNEVGLEAVAQTARITYEDFSRLGVDARRQVFHAADPETKAMLARAHVEDWVHVNRDRLSGHELATFQRVTKAITPELFRSSPQSLVRWQASNTR